MLTDCDDAGLLAMAHAFADDGEIEILATLLNGSDNNDKHGAVVSAINYFVTKHFAEVAPAENWASGLGRD